MAVKIERISCYIRKTSVVLIALSAMLIGCDWSSDQSIELSDSPINLGGVNSPYDDYNASSPLAGETSPLCFSSNRNSEGADFDIVYKLLNMYGTRKDGSFTIAENNSPLEGVYIQNENINDALFKINKSSDELGPYLIPKGAKLKGSTNSVGSYESYIFLFSTNVAGNQDISYLHNLDAEGYNLPQLVTFLNTPFNDAYPSLSSDSTMLYFCSDREGQFDIYKALLSTQETLLQNLADPSPMEILKVPDLSSALDDKCPYVVKNILVFTSNRAGGFGGFDLYYSIFESKSWSTPINFGNKVNTAFDEYRPIIKTMGDSFTKDLILFSSNRPGGKGGFDLYFVAAPFKIE